MSGLWPGWREAASAGLVASSRDEPEVSRVAQA